MYKKKLSKITYEENLLFLLFGYIFGGFGGHGVPVVQQLSNDQGVGTCGANEHRDHCFVAGFLNRREYSSQRTKEEHETGRCGQLTGAAIFIVGTSLR